MTFAWQTINLTSESGLRFTLIFFHECFILTNNLSANISQLLFVRAIQYIMPDINHIQSIDVHVILLKCKKPRNIACVLYKFIFKYFLRVLYVRTIRGFKISIRERDA